MSYSESIITGYDAYAHHDRLLMTNHLEEVRRRDPSDGGVPLPDPRTLLASSQKAYRVDSPKASPTIGILGAGAAGLYTALMLDDIGMDYHILEAQDRVGGRLFTYKFGDDFGSPYNYYDIGAMRFPKIKPMTRLWNLFNYDNLNKGNDPLRGRLTPYIFGDDSSPTFRYYNSKRYRTNEIPRRPFDAKAVIWDADAEPYIAAGVKDITDDVIARFARPLLDDMKNHTTTGWEKLMKFDGYSTRSYMTTIYRPSTELQSKLKLKQLSLPDTALPTDVVNWLETFDKSTGWYDRALSETVLEAIAFGWDPPDTDPVEPTQWSCLNGGAQYLADAMANYIRSRKPNAIKFNSRVTKIALSEDGGGMEVVSSGKAFFYPMVVSTIPLTVLRTIDISQAKFSPMQSNALRELNYGPSIKVGMQFQTAWWTEGVDRDGRKLGIIGAQSFTDRPLRTVVYPSFGDAQHGKTTTLIASYCWTEDAARLGALIDNDKNFLVDLVLRELADIHNVDLDYLTGQLMGTHAWSWAHDPYTMGAFAFFGPGKFQSPYVSLNKPAAERRLFIASEALSVRHAWVEGALDSAWRAVAQIVRLTGTEEQKKRFEERWGKNAEWFDAETVFEGDRDGKELPSIFDDEHSLLMRHLKCAP